MTIKELEKGTIDAFIAWRKDNSIKIEYQSRWPKENEYDIWCDSNTNAPRWDEGYYYRIAEPVEEKKVYADFRVWNYPMTHKEIRTYENRNGVPYLTQIVASELDVRTTSWSCWQVIPGTDHYEDGSPVNE